MYKLKVYQHDVGKRSPFPLIYLFKQAEFEEFRQGFETFIGFPIRHHGGVKWGELRIHEINGEKNKDKKTLREIVPDLFDPQVKWQVAVPILALQRYGQLAVPNAEEKGLINQATVKADEEGRPYAAFLTAQKWGNWRAEKVGAEPRPHPAYPRTAYLVTRDEVFVPVCNACPRVLIHEAGGCHIGDQVCFTHLRQYAADNMFFKHISKYQEHYDDLLNGEAGDTDASESAEGPA